MSDKVITLEENTSGAKYLIFQENISAFLHLLTSGAPRPVSSLFPTDLEVQKSCRCFCRTNLCRKTGVRALKSLEFVFPSDASIETRSILDCVGTSSRSPENLHRQSEVSEHTNYASSWSSTFRRAYHARSQSKTEQGWENVGMLKHRPAM